MNESKPMIIGNNFDLESSVKQVLMLQLVSLVVMVVLVAGVWWLILALQSSETTALLGLLGKKSGASLYGSVLAIAGTILNARSVRRASKVAAKKSNLAMVPIFSGLLNKWVIVGGGIAFGLISLKLAPIEMLISFLIVQLSSVWTILKPGTGTGSKSAAAGSGHS